MEPCKTDWQQVADHSAEMSGKYHQVLTAMEECPHINASNLSINEVVGAVYSAFCEWTDRQNNAIAMLEKELSAEEKT